MEKRDKIRIFFGKEGITSTSANYIANVAKELIRKDQGELDCIDFITETVCTAYTDGSHVTMQGDTKEDLDSLPQKLERVAKTKQLIGWLREAIKAKDEMIKEVTNISTSDVLKKIGYKKEEIPSYLTEYTESEFIATLPEKEQETIQLLNTKAAIFGKFVHEKGALGKARQRVLNCGHTPSAVQSNLKGVVITEKTPSVDAAEIDKVFFDLQTQYREVQKELNSIMFKVKDEMHKENLRIHDFNSDVREKMRMNYEAETAAANKWKKEECKRIGDLKIIIPPSLKAIYDEVNNL